MHEYNAADWQSAPNAELKALLREYEDELEIARQKRDPITGKLIMPDAKGFMIIEDWQTNLKKITLRVNWTKH